METGNMKNEPIDGLNPREQILVRLVESGIGMDAISFIRDKLVLDGYATPDRIEALPYGIERWRSTAPQCWLDLRAKLQTKPFDEMLAAAAKIMKQNRQQRATQ